MGLGCAELQDLLT